MEAQKRALKDGRPTSVLGTLAARCEGADVADEKAPVRTCHRYLSARAGHVNYPQAAEAGLPIGSGEIESAHRYVVQQRLKRPGAWWRVAHADAMITLRTIRINGDWNTYWTNLDPKTLTVANRTASDQPTKAAA